MKRKTVRPPTAEADPNPFRTTRDEAATLRLLISIAQAFKSVDDLVRPRMQTYGLSMTEFSVLEALFHQGPLPLGDLSQRILITGASTTYVVKKLEQRKLMKREPSSEDHRVVLGTITPQGRALLARIFPRHVNDLQEAMASLTTAEKNAASIALKKIIKPL